MAPLSNIWSSITYSVGKATDNILSGRGFYTRFAENRDGILEYRSARAYDSILVHTGKRLGYQAAEHLTNLITDFFSTEMEYAMSRIAGYRKIDKAIKKSKSDDKKSKAEYEEAMAKAAKVREQQKANYQRIIDNGNPESSTLGIVIAEGGGKIKAVNPYGEIVPEALMLYYDTEKEITVEQKRGANSIESFQTKTLCFFDINAQVSQSTQKNIVLTKVQGRDFTRKELVSGGDLTFSVNGMVNSNEPGVYPESGVKKLIQLCQYNGIVKVNHILFQQFGVTHVIIQDYKLNVQECKNEQPYSMSLVAVEPNDPLSIEKDTIQLINTIIVENDNNNNDKDVLEEKKDQIKNGKSNDVRNKYLMWRSNNI